MDSTRERVRAVVAAHAHLVSDIAAVGDGDDLYERGLSSHATVNLMLALENEFEVEFPDADLRRSSFQSIDAIVAILETLGA